MSKQDQINALQHVLNTEISRERICAEQLLEQPDHFVERFGQEWVTRQEGFVKGLRMAEDKINDEIDILKQATTYDN